jgi:hypothetical protein
MKILSKGKATIIAGQESVKITFLTPFLSKPIVNVSCKNESINLYLQSVTSDYVIVNTDFVVDENVEIHYVAIEKS